MLHIRFPQCTPESEYLEEMVLNKWKAVRLSDTEGAEVVYILPYKSADIF